MQKTENQTRTPETCQTLRSNRQTEQGLRKTLEFLSRETNRNEQMQNRTQAKIQSATAHEFKGFKKWRT